MRWDLGVRSGREVIGKKKNRKRAENEVRRRLKKMYA